MKKIKKLLPHKNLAINKKARLKYQILDRIEAGIVLYGDEVKSTKLGHISLNEAFGQIIGGEAWLIGAFISPYKFAQKTQDPKRTRKLLLSKSEITSLASKLQKGTTLVPLRVYLKKKLIKIELGLARGLKLYNRKQLQKEKDLQRELKRELKNIS